MHPVDARSLALQLMREHGLVGWTFRFDHARRRFGSCTPSKKLITLSRAITLLNSVEEVRDTILHEIAHALEPTDGHGPRWRAAAKRIGARPTRCFSEKEVAMPARRPTACQIGCVKCGWWQERHRLTPSNHRCKACGGQVIYRHKASGREFLVSARGEFQWLNEVKYPRQR